MEDSIYTVELAAALSDIQSRFEVHEKEAELKIKTGELEVSNLRQRQLFFGLFILALLVLVGGVVLSQRLKNRRLQAEAEKREKELQVNYEETKKTQSINDMKF